MKPRVLFLLKLREDGYGQDCGYPGYSEGLSSGLYNSARLVVEMLRDAGVEAKLAQVVDNNSIDREVSLYRPTHAIIEGLWVVPEKFRVLIPLHPSVQWIVRIHSEIPFLALEGVALEWVARYVRFAQVLVAANSRRAHRDLAEYVESTGILARTKVLLLPNYYWPGERNREIEEEMVHPRERGEGIVRIGCFGAIRPLKNQLIQAMAAVEFAERRGKRLRFYITARDAQQGGDQVLRNIRALFEFAGHELIELPWLAHRDFVRLAARMDAGLCVSLSETFCIVAADLVSAGVPIVVSREIPWATWASEADPNDLESIVRTLDHVTGPGHSLIVGLNRHNLREYSEYSRNIWFRYLYK